MVSVTRLILVRYDDRPCGGQNLPDPKPVSGDNHMISATPTMLNSKAKVKRGMMMETDIIIQYAGANNNDMIQSK
jgi:hypothetical protein